MMVRVPAAATDDLQVTRTNDADVATAKAALRARVRADRGRRPALDRDADAWLLADRVMELPEVAASRCVTLYDSMPNEPGTAPLRAALSAAGIRILLPIVLGKGPLDWAVDEGPLRPTTRLGGGEPTGPRLGAAGIALADLVLIPALAVDTLGLRLGQGAGYYDRALPLARPGVPVFALVFDGEVLDAAVEPVPAQRHDHRVDAVVTPRRCLRLT
jgi:5-formyltetrahydrofolate cyclo-ligase